MPPTALTCACRPCASRCRLQRRCGPPRRARRRRWSVARSSPRRERAVLRSECHSPCAARPSRRPAVATVRRCRVARGRAIRAGFGDRDLVRGARRSRPSACARSSGWSPRHARRSASAICLGLLQIARAHRRKARFKAQRMMHQRDDLLLDAPRSSRRAWRHRRGHRSAARCRLAAPQACARLGEIVRASATDRWPGNATCAVTSCAEQREHAPVIGIAAGRQT